MRTRHKPACLWLGWKCTVLTIYSSYNFGSTSVAITFLSSDCTVTWSICWLCNCSSSVTSSIRIWDATKIRWIAMKFCQVWCRTRRFSIVTKWILVRSQIWQRDVKERLILPNLPIDHVVIRSELSYLIRANNVRLKCQVFGCKSSPSAKVRVSVW